MSLIEKIKSNEIIPEIHREGINAHQSFYTYSLLLRTPGVGVEVIGSFLSFEAAINTATRLGIPAQQICQCF